MRVAYFDCFAGISGDMILGALLDAGLNLNLLKRELAKLKIKGLKIVAKRVKRHQISATQVQIKGEQRFPSLRSLVNLVEKSSLSKVTRSLSKEIFFRLAKAEAKVHGITPEEVHFHEMEGVDTAVDVIGSAIGLEILGVKQVYSSPVSMGRGFIKCQHGKLPLPAPATAELVKGLQIRFTPVEAELTTPTGAAILSALSPHSEEMPPLIVERVGYGAGSRELEEIPNILRIFMGILQETFERDWIKVIETNIDDLSPQVYDYLFDRLFAKGALEAWLTPVIMKKSRPAVLLTVLTDSKNEEEITSLILEETTTLGLRSYSVDRKKLFREFKILKTRWGEVKIKMACLPGGKIKIIPEYEDCEKIAKRERIPLRDVMEEVIGEAKNAGF